jgi:hypothetical protein
VKSGVRRCGGIVGWGGKAKRGTFENVYDVDVAKLQQGTDDGDLFSSKHVLFWENMRALLPRFAGGLRDRSVAQVYT